jgi:hypothetical protein
MGAPKGNKNHLMHGLYAKDISPIEADAVNKMSSDLSHEIFLLQVFVLRIIHRQAGKIDYDKEDYKLLRLMAYMCQVIGTLTTRRAYLNGEIGEADMVIDSLVERNSGFWLKA